MENSQPPIEELLLEYELGQLAEAERTRVEEALAASSALRERQVVLRNAFDGLDGWTVPAAPAYLVGQVLSAVNRPSLEVSAPAAASALPAAPDGMMTSGPILTFRELAAIAACVTLFVGIFVPAGVKARNMAWRATCAQNLQLVAAGLGRYAEAYNNQLPSAGTVANAYWAPGPRGVVRTSNTRHPYMLVKLKFIDSPALFVCPSRRDARSMHADDYAAFDDVAERDNFTYAYQNMNTDRAASWRVNPQMAIMADANPLFGDGAAHQISPYHRDANSPDHDQEDGQNVLFADGSVLWTTSPNVGIDQDNIWTPAGQSDATALDPQAEPASPTDSFLLNSH